MTKHHNVHKIAHEGVHHAPHARKHRKTGGKAHYKGASLPASHGEPESAMDGDNDAEMDLRMNPSARVDAKNIDSEAEAMGERKRGGRAHRKHGGMLAIMMMKKKKKEVGKMYGGETHHHAGRKPRKSGGKAITADSLINRNAKEANEERAGEKHIGGMKKGGRAHKMGGGMMPGRGAKVAAMLGARQAAAGRGMPPRAGAAPMAPPMLRPMKKGGAAHKMDGGPMVGGPGDVNKINVPTGGIYGNSMTGARSPLLNLKRGGKAGHPDVAEDKALIRKMVKPEARTGKKHGGEKWISSAIKHAHSPSCIPPPFRPQLRLPESVEAFGYPRHAC